MSTSFTSYIVRLDHVTIAIYTQSFDLQILKILHQNIFILLLFLLA
jgi:hypothetical protein